jgi:hypothetical protein
LNVTLRARSIVMLAALVAAGAAPAPATPTPKPTATSVKMHLPDFPLHSEVVVEVNSKGQVVRVKSTKPSKVASFNLQTYGNALQMWIRHPNGTAQVGLYRVTYDYNPKNQSVTRKIAIISTGGTWANDPGAATVMIQMAQKQAAAAEAAEAAAQHKQQEQSSKLPSLNEIRGVATPKPTNAPTLPPA